MSEFKGTKGKLCVTFNWSDTEIEIGTESQSEIAIIDKSNYEDDNEAIANSVLFSKAPEMLEMLQNIAKGFHDSKKHLIIKKAEKLIKEATELK